MEKILRFPKRFLSRVNWVMKRLLERSSAFSTVHGVQLNVYPKVYPKLRAIPSRAVFMFRPVCWLIFMFGGSFLAYKYRGSCMISFSMICNVCTSGRGLFAILLGFIDRFCSHWILSFITKTRMYNFDPRNPHFYIVKQGYTLFFLFLTSTHNLCFEQKYKKISECFI